MATVDPGASSPTKSSESPARTAGEPSGDRPTRWNALLDRWLWDCRPVWFDHASRRLGLKGKLVIAVTLLVALGVSASCVVFLRQSNATIDDLLGEQARQISVALAMGGRRAIETGNREELRAAGLDLIKSRNILFVVYYDHAGNLLAVASRDPEFVGRSQPYLPERVHDLMQVQSVDDPLLGPHLQVYAPVIEGGRRLMGYVQVGVSVSAEQAQVRRTNALVMLIGCAITLACIPVGYALVHRLFHPVRLMVAATNRIAGGDLDTQVPVAGDNDPIAVLARSFNEMVMVVKLQRQELEHANDELNRVNRDLEQANHDLEQKVADRTLLLETANRRLSKEIQDKEDFLRAVSHDLGAPLRNISGMATMLMLKHRSELSDEAIDRLERIRKNVEIQNSLIGELLELSRIKTRRGRLEPVKPTELVEELRGMFDNDLRTRQIRLFVEPDMPVVNVERARLRQVFQNLIDNAIKYMGDGETREIHVGGGLSPGEATFFVRDTGLGIEPGDTDKVFGVFRRGKSPATASVAGKGVGLASVKSIVETYDGTIWVTSTPGAGSQFTFTINGRFVTGGTAAPAGAAA